MVDDLREVPRRHPSLDVGIWHLGGTRVLGLTVTMDGRQGADLLELVRPARTVPVHHDDYGVFRSPLSGLPRRGRSGAGCPACGRWRAARRCRCRCPEGGPSSPGRGRPVTAWGVVWHRGRVTDVLPAHPRRGRARPARPRRARRPAARGPVDRDRGPGHRPAAGARRPAHRLGQVGRLLRRHRAAARPRRRARRSSSARCSRSCATRSRRPPGPASGPSRVNSSNVDEWAQVYADVQAGAVDVLLVSPERLNNPGFRDERAAAARAQRPACSSSTRRTASPTGATTSGPTTAGIRTLLGRAAATARRCWPPPRPPTRGSSPTSPSSCRRGHAGAARLAGPRVAAPGGRPRCPSPAHRLAWLADHLDAAPGLRHRLHAHRRRDRGGGRVPAQPRGLGGARTPAGPRTPSAAQAEDDLLGNRIKALVATSALGHGLRQARPRVRRAPRRAAVADRLLPAGRPRRPRRRPGRGRAAARRARTRRSGATSPRSASRPRSRSAPTLAALGEPPAVDRRRSRRGSTCAGPGSRRCSRCSTSTARSGGSGAAGPSPASRGRYDADRYAGSPRTGRPSSRRCASTPPPRAAGWSSCAGSSTTPSARPGSAVRPLRPLHRRAARRRRSRTRRCEAAQARLGRPGRRDRAPRSSGRPGWPPSASTAQGADPGRPAGRRRAGRSAGCPTSAGAPGCGQLLAGGPTGRCPTTCSRAVVEVLAGWGWEQRPGGVVAVPSRAPAASWSAASRRGSPRSGGCRCSARSSAPATSRAGRPQQQRAAAARRRTARSPCPPTCAAALDGGPVLLVDDVLDTGWTLTEAARLLRESGVRPGPAAGARRRRLSRAAAVRHCGRTRAPVRSHLSARSDRRAPPHVAAGDKRSVEPACLLAATAAPPPVAAGGRAGRRLPAAGQDAGTDDRRSPVAERLSAYYRVTPTSNGKPRPPWFSRRRALRLVPRRLRAGGRAGRHRVRGRRRRAGRARRARRPTGPVLPVRGGSAPKSFRRLLDLATAREDGDALVWFAEDDYVYRPEALGAGGGRRPGAAAGRPVRGLHAGQRRLAPPARQPARACARRSSASTSAARRGGGPGTARRRSGCARRRCGRTPGCCGCAAAPAGPGTTRAWQPCRGCRRTRCGALHRDLFLRPSRASAGRVVSRPLLRAAVDAGAPTAEPRRGCRRSSTWPPRRAGLRRAR